MSCISSYRMVIRIVALILTVVAISFTAQASSVLDGHTTVELDSGTINELTSLGFTITSISPASLNGLTASFPIVSEGNGIVDHSGGLDLTQSNSTVGIQDFVINLRTDSLSGLFTADGVYLSGVGFFDLTVSGTDYNLTLDSQLAGILHRVYGIPDLTGTAIGTATITPAPEPASIALIAASLLAAFCFRSFRQRRQRITR